MLRFGLLNKTHARIERGDRGSTTPEMISFLKIGFLSNTGLDPLEIHKATKPAFNEMAFRWRAYDGLH